MWKWSMKECSIKLPQMSSIIMSILKFLVVTLVHGLIYLHKWNQESHAQNIPPKLHKLQANSVPSFNYANWNPNIHVEWISGT